MYDPTGMWTVSGVLVSATIHGIIGSVVGGVLGGLDALAGGGGFWDVMEGVGNGAMWGFVFGFIGGGLGGLFGKALWLLRAGLIANLIGTAYGVYDSISNGRGWQAAFRLTIGIAGLRAMRKQLFGSTSPEGKPTWLTSVNISEVQAQLEQSLMGRWAWGLAQRLGINIKIVFKPNLGKRGFFRSVENLIVINAARHRSAKEMAITFVHEVIHAFGIRGTVLSEVVARLGSGRGTDSISQAAYLTLLTIKSYGGLLPLIGVGEGGVYVSIFSLEDSEDGSDE
jgi:hypothetical protein